MPEENAKEQRHHCGTCQASCWSCVRSSYLGHGCLLQPPGQGAAALLRGSGSGCRKRRRETGFRSRLAWGLTPCSALNDGDLTRCHFCRVLFSVGNMLRLSMLLPCSPRSPSCLPRAPTNMLLLPSLVPKTCLPPCSLIVLRLLRIFDLYSDNVDAARTRAGLITSSSGPPKPTISLRLSSALGRQLTRTLPGPFVDEDRFAAGSLPVPKSAPYTQTEGSRKLPSLMLEIFVSRKACSGIWAFWVCRLVIPGGRTTSQIHFSSPWKQGLSARSDVLEN